MASRKGTKGNDVLTGTASNDVFTLTQGGNDTANGLGGNDLFKFGATFTAKDKIDGGGGQDTLALNGDYSKGVTFGAKTVAAVETIKLGARHDYKLITNDATVARNKMLTVDASKLGAANALTFNGIHETDGKFDLIGGKGNDALTGGAKADTFDLAHGGNDTAKGGGGNDVFNLGGAFTAADMINGGNGTDTLSLNGNYAGARAIVFGAKSVSIEKVVLGAGHNYALTTANATVAAGATLTVDADALTAGNTLHFNGAAETNGKFSIIGGAGNDILTGGALADAFDLSHGGNDTVTGGGGNDIFKFGAAFNAQDHVDGGAGNDTITVSGDYSTGLVFAGGELSSVETIKLGAINTDLIQIVGNFTSSLIAASTTIAPGSLLTVDASGMAAGVGLHFNGSAETDGIFSIIGSAGNDVLTGGGLFDTFDLSHGGNDAVSSGGANDIFDFGATFNAQDHVDGGDGNDTLILTGDYGTLTLDGSNTVSVETVELGAGHSYNVVMGNDFTPANHTALIDGSLLLSTDTLTFDGTGETDGATQAIGGAGADVLIGGPNGDILQGAAGDDYIDFSHDTSRSFAATGGTGADTFNVGGALVSSDHIDGGTGDDTVIITGDNFTDSITFNSTTLQNIDKLEFTGTSAPAIITNDATVATGETMEVDAHALTGGLTFDGHLETDGHFTIAGGAGTNFIIGGRLGDTITGGAGEDIYAYFKTQSYAGAKYDTITNIDFSHDVVAIYTTAAENAFVTPAAIDATIASGSLSVSTIDSDLAAAASASHLHAHDAVLFTPTAGGLSGHAFLIVDMNGTAGYQAGSDLVIDVTGFHGTLGITSFAGA